MISWRRETREQTALIDALHKEILALPDIRENAESRAESAWLAHRSELKRRILEDDPLRFLDWDVVTGSMFVGNRPFVDNELSLPDEARPDWKQRLGRGPTRKTRQVTRNPTKGTGKAPETASTKPITFAASRKRRDYRCTGSP